MASWDELNKRVGGSSSGVTSGGSTWDAINKSASEGIRKQLTSRAKTIRLRDVQKNASDLEIESNKPLYRVARATDPAKFGDYGKSILKFGKEAIGGGVEKITQAHSQRIIDNQLQQNIQNRKELIKQYQQKKNDAADKDKQKYNEAITSLVELNLKEVEEVGGELKNMTDLQLLGMSLEGAIEVGTLGGAGLLKGLGKTALLKTPRLSKAISKVIKNSGDKATALNTSAQLRRAATSHTGVGAQLGAGIGTALGLQEENPTLSSVATQGAIGAVAGGALVKGTKYIGSKFKSKKTVDDIFDDKKELPKQENAVDINIQQKTGGMDTPEYIASRGDAKIVNVKENIVDPVTGDEYTTHYNKEDNEILISNNASKEDINNVAAHYIVNKKAKSIQSAREEVIEITGGKGELEDDAIEAISKVMIDSNVREKFPKLAKIVDGEGITTVKKGKDIKEDISFRAKEDKEAMNKSIIDDAEEKLRGLLKEPIKLKGKARIKKLKEIQNLQKRITKFKEKVEKESTQEPLASKTDNVVEDTKESKPQSVTIEGDTYNVSKLSKKLIARAREAGVEEKDLKAQTFLRKTTDEESNKLTKIIEDRDKVIAILNGDEKLPDDMSESIFIHLSNQLANSTNDKALAKALGNTSLARKSTEHAQELSFLQNIDKDSYGEKARDVVAGRRKKTKKTIDSEVDKLSDKLDATGGKWSTFINSIPNC